MLPDYHKIWGIVEEHRFSEELAAIESDPIRADEFIDGAKEVLSRNPEAGTKLGERVWFLPMAMTDVGLFYTIEVEEERVHFQSIQRIPDVEEEDEDDEKSS